MFSSVRLLAVILVLVATAPSCSSADDGAQPAIGEAVQSPAPTTTSPAEFQPPPLEGEPEKVLLLPDPTRWVVVEDWGARRSGEPASVEDFEDLQLDVAPVVDGVPQLGQRISMRFRIGEFGEFGSQWGDASSLGDVIELDLADSVGRVVHEETGFGVAQVWRNGTFVLLQGRDVSNQLADLASSLTEVDEATWLAAREGAAGQRLVAVQAAMETADVVEVAGLPLPHWVLPAPWEPEWVTDKTIWTAEQHAQSAGLAEASQPPQQAPDSEHEVWRFGYRQTPGAARVAFVPDLLVAVSVFDEPPGDSYPTNYDKITALGLDGVISGTPGHVVAELGLGQVRVWVNSSTLSSEELTTFLAAAQFATDDPLDGVVVADPRFQLIDFLPWEERPPSWHASWRNPDGGEAVTSVWRLTIFELRAWLETRGQGLTVPEDIWAHIADGGPIDFGSGTTYEVEEQLLISLRGIERDQLIPIALDDWIELVEPVNTDPLNPR